MKLGKYIYVYAGLLVVGLVGGYIYWHFWGCTDSCPIDSDWRLTMGRGGLIGLLVAGIFQPSKKKAKAPLQEDDLQPSTDSEDEVSQE